MIFVTAKTPRDAGGYVQIFGSLSTYKNFIYRFLHLKKPHRTPEAMSNFLATQVLVEISYIDFLRVKNPHGWPEVLSKIWNRHVAKAFSVSNWPQITGWIWNYLNQLNLKTMSDWVLKLNYGHLQRPKRIVLVLRKTKVFALQKTLKKSKSPYGVTGAFCQIIFVLRKNKYFFGSPKILEKTKMSLWA